MTSLPLHPAIVHLPLGLAFLLPALALGLAWALWTGRVRPRAWAVLVALQTILLAAGIVAMKTGEREEDRVERLVPETAIEEHEALAEQFLWATGATLGISALVLVLPWPATRRMALLLTVAGAIAVTAAAVRVGHAGGRLVYVHNAGAAYSAGTSAAGGIAAAESARLKPESGRRGSRATRGSTDD